MVELSLDDALRLAINVLRDAAESGRMPSGEALSAEAAEVQRVAADLLAEELRDSEDLLNGRPLGR